MKINLHHPTHGNLTIINCYLHSGADQTHPRRILYQEIAQQVPPTHTHTTIMAGDFNFVEHREDRLHLRNMDYTGDKDSQETNHFKQTLTNPHHLQAVFQPHYTHKTTTTMAKLDRFYLNHHPYDQIDHTFHCTTLGWNADLSDHSPLLLTKRATGQSTLINIPPHHYKNPAWASRLHWTYQELLHTRTNHTPPRQADIHPNKKRRTPPPLHPLQKLKLYKEAMWTLSLQLHQEEQTLPNQFKQEPSNDEETLSHMIRTIRSITTYNNTKPPTWSFLSNTNEHADEWNKALSNHKGSERIRAIKDLTLLLYQKTTTDGCNHNNDENPNEEHDSTRTATNSNANHHPGQHNRTKSKLAHLKPPGVALTLGAMEDDDGNITTDTKQMASLLRSHWSKTFSHTDTNPHHTKKWLQHAYKDGPPCQHSTTREWTPRKKDLTRAIHLSNSSSPGPDGVPYGAWRNSGDEATEILWQALQTLYTDPTAHTQYDTFNHALLVCLPKKPTSTTPDGQNTYHSGNTRPLAISNTDNRLLASACRIRWERVAAEHVHPHQRGFLPKRSMLFNVVEIDHLAHIYSLHHNDPTLVLYDFTAAFPSISRSFTLEALRAFGAPDLVLHTMGNFYHNNYLDLKLHGGTHPGFTASRGIRQGCPLSPLIFAIATDSLLRIIEQKMPGTHLRTFADDTAALLTSWQHHSTKLHTIMTTYSSITSMSINTTKTIAIPLGDHTASEMRDKYTSPEAVTQGYPQYAWADQGKYLGFVIGPQAYDTTWLAPTTKYTNRLQEWPWSTLGLHLTIRIYNTFILPTLLFVAQLSHPPALTLQAESKAASKLAPGPRAWCTMEDLQHFTDYGAAQEIHSLHIRAAATMLRTAWWENHAHGGIPWKRMSEELRHHMQHSDHLGRQGRHAHWHRQHFATVVHQHTLSFQEKHHINLNNTRDDITQNAPMPLTETLHNKWRKTTQTWITRFLRQRSTYRPQEKIRRQLKKTPLTGWPRRLAATCAANLAWIFRHMAPRVAHTCWHTIWGRWCTHTRMGTRKKDRTSNRCMFGCKNYEDSLPHYRRCPILRHWTHNRLQLRFTHEQALNIWTFTTKMTNEDLGKAAIMVYAAYRCTNHLRHSPRAPSEEEQQTTAKQYLNQIIHEADRGNHKFSLKAPHLDSCRPDTKRKSHNNPTNHTHKSPATSTTQPTPQSLPPRHRTLPDQSWIATSSQHQPHTHFHNILHTPPPPHNSTELTPTPPPGKKARLTILEALANW